jgi:surface protein
MPEIGKISTVAIGSIGKISGILKASVGELLGLAPPASFTWADDKSLDFDGTNDYVDVSGVDTTINITTGSVSVWVKLDTVGVSVTAFMAAIDANNFIRVWYKNSDSTLRWQFKRGGTNNVINFSSAIENDGNWHHLTMTWSTNDLKGYLDGLEVASGTMSGTFSGTIDTVHIGRLTTSSAGYWLGNIDEVALFTTALTAANVRAIYNSGDPTDLSGESGLIGYWLLGDSDTYPTITDRSTNSNDGTMTNMVSGDIVTDVPDSAFTFTMNTENAGSATKTFVLPLANDGSINMLVDWGDSSSDTITAYDDSETTHVYDSTGTYTIKITGTIRGWYFNGGGDKLKILNISKWGDFNFTKKNAFKRCTNLTSNATDIPAVNLTDFAFMFESCTAWNPSNISSWDMSGVTRINWMFFGCTNFNQPIGAWDTSNVYELSYMLYNCSAFDQNLSNWNVASVTNYSQFMGNAGISTANYDALLIAWDAQSVSASETPHFGSSTYTAGGAAAAAHANLISSDGWTITDGGETEGGD